MKEITLKIAEPKRPIDKEWACVAAIDRLMTKLRKEYGINYSYGQGGTASDWRNKDFPIPGLFTVMNIYAEPVPVTSKDFKN